MSFSTPAEKSLWLFCRVIAVCAGILGLQWGVSSVAVQFSSDIVRRIGQQIIYFVPFNREILLNLIPRVAAIENAAYCNPGAMRAAAVVRLRLAESVLVGGERRLIDANLDQARTTMLAALRCEPSDSFLWLTYYWINVVQNGFTPDLIPLLERSYSLGPNEVWIAVKRNGLAFSVYDNLPENLRSLLFVEFKNLVKTGFYEETANILTGPAWNMHDRLLDSLSDLPERNRYLFSQVLRQRGFDLVVAGVTMPPDRPWR